MKALQLLKTNPSVQERAEAYVKSIKRDLQKEVIDTLITTKEKAEDQLFELKNFTLDTNVNQGLAQMTKEDCKKRFKNIIEFEYQLILLEAELKVKQASFDKYFGDEEA
jgi:predicted polyphosphate/ATP-dependent NAD kinase